MCVCALTDLTGADLTRTEGIEVKQVAIKAVSDRFRLQCKRNLPRRPRHKRRPRHRPSCLACDSESARLYLPRVVCVHAFVKEKRANPTGIKGIDRGEESDC